MPLLKNRNVLIKRAETLKREITAVYYANRHPDVRILPKLIILFTIGYALSPVDFIPDFIPLLGYLDDLILLPALIALSIHLIPREIMEESRQMAKENPVSLKKNWFFACIIILIWAILISVILKRFLMYAY